VALLHWLLYWMLPSLALAFAWIVIAGPRCAALAVGTAVIVPFGIVVEWPPWPWELWRSGTGGGRWLVWVFAVGGLAGALQDLRVVPRWLAPVLDAALLALLPWVLLAGQRAGWRPESMLLHFVVVWFAIGGAWWALRTALVARPGVLPPIAAAAMLGGDALVLANGGNPLLWQGATVAGLAVLAAAGAAYARRPFAFGAGLALQLALMHGSLLLAGRYFGRLGAVPALLAALAPVPIGLAMRTPKARGRSFATGSRTAAGLLCSAALIAAAAWLSRA
jgi:hypothetical protein